MIHTTFTLPHVTTHPTVSDTIIEVVRRAEDAVRTSDLVDEVVAITGSTPGNVQNEITRLVEAGRIRRPRIGYYVVPEDEPEAAPRSVRSVDNLVFLPLVSLRGTRETSMSNPFTTEVETYLGEDRRRVRETHGLDPEHIRYMIHSGRDLPGVPPGSRLKLYVNGERRRSGSLYLWESRTGIVAVAYLKLLPGDKFGMSWREEGDDVLEPLSADDPDPTWKIIARVLTVERFT